LSHYAFCLAANEDVICVLTDRDGGIYVKAKNRATGKYRAVRCWHVDYV
jgi:hypothetical protein